MAAGADSVRPFVGRVETVEALRRRLEELRSGTGGVTLVVGETGVGKSTLVDELVADARKRGIPVLIGRAAPLDAPPPFALLRSVIESAHDDPTLRTVEAQGAGGEPILIGFAPGLGEESLPPIANIEERLLGAIEGAGRDEESREEQLARVAEQFREFTRHGPTLVVVEDLHRADDSSLAAVEYLADQLRLERLWVLATCRPYASLSDPGRERMARFEHATRAHQLRLRPLTSAEVSDYLLLLEPTRSYPPEEVLRRFAETGGNPLLLQQLDRRAAAGVPAGGRTAAGVPVLAPEEERIVEVAAVLGPEFRFELLMRVSGEQDEERFTEDLDHLVGLGLLLERSGESFAFPDDRLREDVYGRLTESRKRVLHWSAGESIEATGRGGISTVYALARHFYLGRVAGKSVHYNRMAAEIAERAVAVEVAREHMARALESHRLLDAANVDTEAEIVLELARLTEELGQIPESETILRRFLERERDDPRLAPSRRASVEVFLTRVLTDRGLLPEAVALARKILATPDIERHPLVRLGGFHQLGLALYYEGKYDQALVQHDEELRLAKDVGNELVLLRAQVWRIANLAMLGKTDEAVAEARDVTAARDRIGSVRESAQAHLFFGDILADSRCTPAQREEAVREYAKAIDLAEKAEDPRRVAWASYKTGELLTEHGRYDEAARHLDTAIDLFRRIDDRVGLSMSIKVQGQIALHRHDLDLAETRLLEAQRLLEGLNHALEEIDVILRLAQLSLARKDRTTALRHVAELERRKLSEARPDLEEEFARVKQGLRAEGEDPAT